MAYSLTYSYSSASQSYSVTGYSGITTTDNVVIPSTYNDGTNGSHPVTSIGDSAFSGCSSLTSVTIPNSVTSIGFSAFNGCNSLTSVMIPDSVTSIGGSAFYNCSKLKSVTIPDSVTSIGVQAFLGCSNLASVTIGSGVTSISNSVFNNCIKLKSVTIRNGVTSIGTQSFYGCDSLTSVTIPDSVTSIGSSAFRSCDSLTSVTIGSGVTSISNSVFNNCSNLTQLILFPSTPPTLGSGAIPTTISKIYVQKSSKAAYDAATNWTAFTNKIVSDDLYLSFARFNEKNKQYIKASIPDTSTFAKVSDLTDGTITVENAMNATNAQFADLANAATADDAGNVIPDTYATKTQLSDGSVTKIGNAIKVGTAIYDGSAAVNAGRRSWYGTCATATATSAKEVNDCPDFVLETGAKVSIRFTYANSVGSPTLNVNGTGAKSIRNSNSAAGTLTYRWYPYQVVDFVYDGTYWLLQQPVVATTTYYGVSKVATATVGGTSSGTVEAPHITKYYRSGSTWARKWSDGFIECGGLATGNTVNVSFLSDYNFVTTNYCVALCYQNSDSSAGINIVNVSAYNKATTGFTIRNASNSTFNRTWMAFGY